MSTVIISYINKQLVGEQKALPPHFLLICWLLAHISWELINSTSEQALDDLHSERDLCIPGLSQHAAVPSPPRVCDKLTQC